MNIIKRRVICLLRFTLLFAFIISIPTNALAQQVLSANATLIRNSSTHKIPGKQTRVIAVIGDGFAASDQASFSDYVNDSLMVDGLGGSALGEVPDAFDIYRIDVVSPESGISENCTGKPVTTVNSAFGWGMNCQNTQCWFNSGNTRTLNATIAAAIPNRTVNDVVLVLNTSSFGGCKSGNRVTLTLAPSATFVAAHEFGHLIGNLADEYTASNASASNVLPRGRRLTAANLDVPLLPNERRAYKWQEFIAPNVSPLYGKGSSPVAPLNNYVGSFAGGTFNLTGYNVNLMHPAQQCRMNTNTPEYDPVCYNKMRLSLEQFSSYTYENPLFGDFNGDGSYDMLLHFANALSLYEASTESFQFNARVQNNPSNPSPAIFKNSKNSVLDFKSSQSGKIKNGNIEWTFEGGDDYLVADFSGDSIDDLFTWNLDPSDWANSHFALLKSNGEKDKNQFSPVVIYQGTLPGAVHLTTGSTFRAADFNGDGMSDLLVISPQANNTIALSIFQASRSELTNIVTYAAGQKDLPGWGSLKSTDVFIPADFDSDGKFDIYGIDPIGGKLTMYKSTGSGFVSLKTYDKTLPGWGNISDIDIAKSAKLGNKKRQGLWIIDKASKVGAVVSNGNSLSTFTVPNLENANQDGVALYLPLADLDQYQIGDVDGNGQDDLVIFNPERADKPFLGVVSIQPNNSFQFSYAVDSIGGLWEIEPGDVVNLTDYTGDKKSDVILYNTTPIKKNPVPRQNQRAPQIMAIIKSTLMNSPIGKVDPFITTGLYPGWIENIPYHKSGAW